jgi:bacteriorhodopsin
LLAEEKGFKGSFAVPAVFNVLMIVAGYFYDFPDESPFDEKLSSQIWYLISVASMLIVLYYVFKWDKYLKESGVDTKLLPYYFYFGWTAYGLNALTPSENLKTSVFDVLDFLNKGAFSLTMNSVIKDHFGDSA